MSDAALLLSLDLLRDTAPVSCEDDEILEAQAMNDLLVLARTLAKKYENPYRWPLDKEEIFGELTLEIVKSINKYLYCKSYNQYLKLARKMLWNRMKEILTQAYGTKRGKTEGTAQKLPEELDEYGETYDPIPTLILSDFYSKLSDTAKKVYDCVSDPDEKMHEIIAEHITYRGKLYKSGGGMSGVPKKLVAKYLQLDIKEIQNAYTEIEEAIRNEDKLMDDITLVYKDLKFDQQFISWKDYTVKGHNVRYIRWNTRHLIAQAKFRGIYKEGMKLSQVIQVMREDDKRHGLGSDEELELMPEQTAKAVTNAPAKQEEAVTARVKQEDWVEFEDELPRSGGKDDPAIIKPSQQPEFDDDDDEMFAPKKPAAKENLMEEVYNAGKDAENYDPFEAEETNPKPNNDTPDTKQSPNQLEETKQMLSKENFHLVGALVQNMREGEVLLITRLSIDEWKVSFVHDEKLQPIESSESHNTKTRKTKTKAYAELEKKFRALNNEEVLKYITDAGVEWKHSDDVRVNRMFAVQAFYRKMNINKYED